MRTNLRATFGRLLAASVVAALAVAGVAVADAGPVATAQVSATFYANTLVTSQTTNCTGANNDAYQLVRARFTGTAASGDARLAGPVTVDVSSVFDTTKNLGWLSADLRIDTAPPGHFHAHLSGVNMGGTVQGFLNGDGGGFHVLGSFTGAFSATGGFGSSSTPVAIGSGTGTNTALLTSGACAGPPPHGHDIHVGPPKPVHGPVEINHHKVHVEEHSQKHGH